jgi:hypothetical protein
MINISGLRDALLPLPSPAHALKDSDGECIDGKDAIRRRPMNDPIRAPFNFARAGQLFNGSAAAHMIPYSNGHVHQNNASNGYAKTRDPANLSMYKWQCLPENKHILHRFGCAMKAMGDFAPANAVLSGT